ncbi:amino acid adenylation domain-containing protein [Actinopolyspora mortivallis]|uniref:Amino acid adenylation protein n=1 Tax=Actinopolyspora mortivallis TaxID=33906 RepID=A0A2T0GW48_ACTMO|nr:amino acid adenylation domain-containing protein [Actinopolyspora mortivallis]PRW63345.1 amino acid adenylation protein [Actinopolyspora mortivallis]
METTRTRTQKTDSLLATCLTDLLKQQEHMRPGAIAATAGDERMTYHDLVRTSGRLAAYLRHIGVTADSRVGLYVEPSLELMSGVWGILLSGGAYLPLSPEYPAERLRYMIEDSSAHTIFTQEHLAGRLADIAPPETNIVTLRDADSFDSEPTDSIRPDELAYVIYTSGSTGRPKGVMIEHHSVVSQLRWMHACGHLGTDTVVLQKTPMSFDAAQWEILAPAFGSRVVMGTPGAYRDPEQLIRLIGEHGVNTLQCVPTLLRAMLDMDSFQYRTSLRRIFSGGEALPKPLARELLEKLPWVSLVNLYGPTECTINATAYLVDPETLGEETGMLPIGLPVDNTQCYILDEDLAPADIGEIGELYIGGTQLARGYLNRPETTEQRFIPSPFVPTERLYRTGDLAYWHPDGTIQFAGRIDNQVKLRGQRVELDEIGAAIEEHTWVKRAAAVVTDDARTGFHKLVACIELNPVEAALMDQGNHGAHHQTKSDKLQVKTQLSSPGIREPEKLTGRPVVDLPGKQETPYQRREVFSRKTYRFYEGAPVRREDLLELLRPRSVNNFSRNPNELDLNELGEIFRWFGQFHSTERLLPKYFYASPGALYATQLYLEITNELAGLEPGIHYYDPAEHRLVRIGPGERTDGSVPKIHLLGKERAIEPVYKNNLQEVLEFEAGHILGSFEEILPRYGMNIRPSDQREAVKNLLDVSDHDHFLGTFEIGANDGAPRRDPTEIYVQVHPGGVVDLPAGQYRYSHGELEYLSEEIVLAKHVIAINQPVYERASFGITAISRESVDWLEYISLGAKLHHLQRNGLNLGFMSSGYSSKSGHPLPAARRIDDILSSLGIPTGASYFFLGGPISQEQIRGEDMYEDTVHMRGPAEIVEDDLSQLLPEYMLPNRILVLDELPLTANGKIDRQALAASEEVNAVGTATPYVAPATRSERWLAEAWGTALKYENVSVEDDFFDSGGNSLIAVKLINRINEEFGVQLPMQTVFEHPKMADLAARIDNDSPVESSRLVPLADGGGSGNVFCWPGLGGYPMNLRPLAREITTDGTFYGVQAHGINTGEVPYRTIHEMAAADVAEIRRVQPEGPYILCGYSFGARVAFETCWQLEQLGEEVENLLLICPGNPKLREGYAERYGRSASYDNPTYVSILFSVFAGTVEGPDLEECLEKVRDEEDFVEFVHGLFPDMDERLIRRIIRIVGETYEFEYSLRELVERRINSRVTIFKASGDDYSFIENHSGEFATEPTVVKLDGDHYSVLKEHGVAELGAAIRDRLSDQDQAPERPHE